MVDLCGAQRNALVVGEGARVVARVARMGRRATTLTVERCDAGAWRDRKRIELGHARSHALETRVVGDYRVRAGGGGRRSRPVYLRVGAGEIVDLPLRFRVRNINRSKVPCPTDGQAHFVAGQLVAPRAALTSQRPAVTLYLHGGAIAGRGTFRFGEVAGYDYAYEQAKAGHASVTIDQLGYGSSAIPDGFAVCAGGQADIAHQVVSALRSGGYAMQPEQPVRFAHVALGAHSLGGLIAPIEAYSFSDVDALVIVSSAFDQGGSQRFRTVTAGSALSNCGRGGEPKRPGAAGGYYYTFGDPNTGASLVFANAEQAVMAGIRRLRERDACGTAASIPAALVANRAYLAGIRVPVLFVFGDKDAIFPPPSGENQRDLYRGSPGVTLITIPDAGHNVFLERTAPHARATVSSWLADHGL